MVIDIMKHFLQIRVCEQCVAQVNLQKFSRARKALREYGQSDDWRLPDGDTPLSGKSFSEMPAHHSRDVTTWKVPSWMIRRSKERAAEMPLQLVGSASENFSLTRALFFFFRQLSSFSFSQCSHLSLASGKGTVATSWDEKENEK